MKIILSKTLKDVELKGILKKTKDNFIYLNVPNNLINGFFDCLEEDAQKPPSKQGAHISVISTDEYDSNDIKDIKDEIGKEFSFYLRDMKSVNPAGWDEVKKVWFLQVDSPQLESLRKKYDLSSKLDNHEFHITIAVKEK